MSRTAVPSARGVAKLGLLLALLGTVVTMGYPAVAEEATLPTVDRFTDSAAADNPWRRTTVRVHVAHEGDDSPALDALAERELDHWETNSQRYAGSNVSFELVDERDSADLVVVFQEEVGCGEGRFAVGCARQWTSSRTGRVTHATVWVRTGYDDSITRHTLRHELGHVFGLSHDDADEFPFMRSTVRIHGSG
ncbi:hypothetical protein HUG10_16600 [Halorarum halophilum]|uniref:Matrixin n=1 Tax=Halorarum halophilum TaxID=2743090 RepID=A0A7D5KFL2_9EURY|nr:zinc-dependent metalloprotease family protein [Halobaculum halophilum]QLG29057.1 hypothetical protein HUG10_16600 [Halobaculum halophilum]